MKRSVYFRVVVIIFMVGTFCTLAKGETWQHMDSGTTMWLGDIWGSGPDNVFVVGEAGTILHYNGVSWAPMSSPTGTQLRGVTGWSATSAVAVGLDKTILRYDGTSWNLISGIPGNLTDAYIGVWGTGPNNIFMAGAEHDSAHGLILHWDGISWDRKAFDPPSGTYGMALCNVWGRGTDDVYVSGVRYDGGSSCTRLLYHFDGITWTQDTSPPIGRDMGGIWGDSSNLFVVGSEYGYINRPVMIWRLGTTGWQTHSIYIGSDSTLCDVWGSASDDVYAVGYDDSIVHYDGNGAFNWTIENNNPLGVIFRGIWGSSANDIFVVGSGGTILHRHVNSPPVAVCQDVLVAVGMDGYVDVSVNGGSYDPDGDDIDLSQDPAGPYSVGVYNVELAVTDPYLASDSCQAMLVVYDPSSGFVTGGGWIWSPKGAYSADPWLEGKANFGFVSKYTKGANAPTGQTEFVFQAGDLNFHSSSYDWLLVTGSNYAKFKGRGTINGSEGYQFQIWAGDNDPDTFRIKIWEELSGDVVYDNGMDQAIGGGSIVVHTGKK